MNILDVIILLCCCPLLISGYKKGFINQALSIVTLIAAAWTASGYGDIASEWVRPMIEGKCDKPEQISHIIGIAITFVIVCLSLHLVSALIEKLLLVIIPEWINKILGRSFKILQDYNFDRQPLGRRLLITKAEPKSDPRIESLFAEAIKDWGIRYTWLGKIVRRLKHMIKP